MNLSLHTLPHTSDGAAYELTSLHFGPADTGRKVYIQGGLHADETPGILVAVTLEQQLRELEAAGKLRGEVVLVSAANPVGLSQWVMGAPIGRFDLSSGRNFNRDYPMLAGQIAEAVDGKLTQDSAQNLAVIRGAWRAALLHREPSTTFDALQRSLMLLSHDADIVLDLHCSREAAMHLYTGEAIWPRVEPLARYLGAVASLLALDSGGRSFDEAHSFTWWQLRERFGRDFPIPDGSIAVTVEHRGQRDVSYELARQDADAIIAYLTHQQIVDGPVAPLPDLLGPATPLAGSEQFRAPISGILIHRVKVGETVDIGQPVFDVLDTVSGQCTTLQSHTQGVLYMRRDVRYVRAGDPLGRVTGAVAQRAGMLLSA
ncbi:succinylglutamate desuccinylase/aspartoacylase family protein [Paraburkholderia strydomiana]|uniref:succinylglutamate desuccinylase/aspartoacylase family protein n=1 Tax=Paraburkholderia strydomiana TaxID=1245417 RepID=UPI0035B56AD0